MEPSWRTRNLVFLAALLAALVLWGCSGGSESTQTLTIGYTNDVLGTIRSCGCIANDFGGLGRRATLVEIVEDSTANFLLVDAGDFFGAELNYGKEKADITMKSMALMNYHAVVVGEKEFGLGRDFLVERVHQIGLPVIVANLYDAATDTLLFPPSATATLAGGLTVGLIGVMDPTIKMPPQVEKGSLVVTDPVEAVKREIGELANDVDIIVVLAHEHRRYAQQLAQRIPEIDVLVAGHEGRAMRRGSPTRFGNAFLLQVPKEGRYMGLAFAVIAGNGDIRSLRSSSYPLSKQYPDHEAIAKLFRSYDMSVAAKEKGTVPAAVFEARAGLKKPFAGSNACSECHESEFAQWKETKHAHAFDILTAESRQFDRDCTPCHTTGFYQLGGFEKLQVTPDLIHVGCESCHGNGHDHVADPTITTPGTPREACRKCHNADQTPDFDFDAFWARIHH